MNLENDTYNQHFLSQAEQRLNALNPMARPRNQRIYAFRVADREKHDLVIEDKRGRLIRANLSFPYLFSFDVLPNNPITLNLESLFGRYEQRIMQHTSGLLTKLRAGDRDIKTEIIELFVAKLLNFARNPLSINKMLNTFGVIGTYSPTAPELDDMCHRIIDGRKPQQRYLCSQLGVTEAEYANWLRVLFMMLTPMSQGIYNLYEHIIQSLFEQPETEINVVIYEYKSESCLLSDRGFSEPIRDDVHSAFDFNICAGAFARFAFSDVTKFAAGRAPLKVIEFYRRPRQKTVKVFHLKDDLANLAAYNCRVVEQCFERVYCATKEGVRFHGPAPVTG